MTTRRRNPAPAAPARRPTTHAQAPTFGLPLQTIFCGDNLDKLKTLPDECVDLIYIDPPFNSNRNYEVFWGEAKEKRAFEDRHESTMAYIDFMRPRCMELHRVLKKTGSLYCHCDSHASHYLKVMLDQVFGEDNFQNEVIWQRTGSRSDARRWNTVHDTLFFYAGSKSFTWNPQHAPHSQEYLREKYKYNDPDGRLYRLDNMTSPNPRPNMMYEWKGHASPEKGWRYSRETMERLDAQGRIWYPSDKTKRPQLKRYLDEMSGVALGTVWTDIPPLNSQAIERIGFPTQKPIPLLERIIKASSNPDDIVLDAFCGCGTALVGAQNLDRRWIGIDISPTACRVMSERLRERCGLQEGRDFFVRDLPKSPEELRRYPPFEFENWAVNALNTVLVNGHAIPNRVKVGDKGIDGRIYPIGAAKAKIHGKDLFGDVDYWFPVQVKQKDKAGRPDIDLFETAMRRQGRDKGFFISFGFTADALQEINRVREEIDGMEIIPLTVDEIVSEERRIRL